MKNSGKSYRIGERGARAMATVYYVCPMCRIDCDARRRMAWVFEVCDDSDEHILRDIKDGSRRTRSAAVRAARREIARRVTQTAAVRVE